MNSNNSAAFTTLAPVLQGLREVPFISSYQEVDFPSQSTSNELVIIRIGRYAGDWNWSKTLASVPK
jgi:hypothetical protein